MSLSSFNTFTTSPRTLKVTAQQLNVLRNWSQEHGSESAKAEERMAQRRDNERIQRTNTDLIEQIEVIAKENDELQAYVHSVEEVLKEKIQIQEERLRSFKKENRALRDEVDRLSVERQWSEDLTQNVSSGDLCCSKSIEHDSVENLKKKLMSKDVRIRILMMENRDLRTQVNAKCKSMMEKAERRIEKMQWEMAQRYEAQIKSLSEAVRNLEEQNANLVGMTESMNVPRSGTVNLLNRYLTRDGTFDPSLLPKLASMSESNDTASCTMNTAHPVQFGTIRSASSGFECSLYSPMMEQTRGRSHAQFQTVDSNPITTESPQDTNSNASYTQSSVQWIKQRLWGSL